MSPFVRDRILPEVESTGRAKSFLDLLLWLPKITPNELTPLDLIEVLRIHLLSIRPSPCFINLWVPSVCVETGRILSALGIAFKTVSVAKPDDKVSETLKGGPPELLDAAATGLSVDADVVVVANIEWFPYVLEFDKLDMLLADCGIVQRQCEIFVRGHDVPWSFDHMVWNGPWTSFYQLTEMRTGLAFLERCQKSTDAETFDAARMLIHNRLPNLCFTRDRLLFYGMQQSAARRAQWERQEFLFEAAYYLNFYYMLIHGGFDHLAVVLNGALSLGVAPRDVGATYESFLTPLSLKGAEIHALFTSPDFMVFQERIAALRHFAAHRGSIMPGTMYETPEQEPTLQQLDEEIARQGRDDFLRFIPRGPLQDAFRETLRFKVRLSKYKKAAEGVVFLEIKGKKYLIKPMNDIEWNFSKFHKFMTKVLNTALDRLQGQH